MLLQAPEPLFSSMVVPTFEKINIMLPYTVYGLFMSILYVGIATMIVEGMSHYAD